MSWLKKFWQWLLSLFTAPQNPPAPPAPPVPPGPPSPPAAKKVWWINNSNGSLSQTDAQAIVDALNVQVSHLSRFWAATPVQHVLCASVGVTPTVPAGDVKAYWLPSADVAGALGYHDVDPSGDPYIKVFVDTIIQAGGTALSGAVSVSVCSSHEACEEAVDPGCGATAKAPNGDTWALEVGDPVESFFYNVLVGSTNVAVSDFVTPAFFNLGAGILDYMGKAVGPFKIAPGGYAIINGQSVFASGYPEWRKATKAWPTARTARRGVRSA